MAFDVPANGESAGRRTDVRDWLAAIGALQSREGRFHTVIGHSFGAMTSAAAIRNGASAGALVAIAGMADARYLVDSFAARVGVGAATADSLADRTRFSPGRVRFAIPRPPLDTLRGGRLRILFYQRDRAPVAGDGTPRNSTSYANSQLFLLSAAR